jgi:hypothetical protein
MKRSVIRGLVRRNAGPDFASSRSVTPVVIAGEEPQRFGLTIETDFLLLRNSKVILL